MEGFLDGFGHDKLFSKSSQGKAMIYKKVIQNHNFNKP